MGRKLYKLSEHDIDLMTRLYVGNESTPGLSLRRIEALFSALEKPVTRQLIGYHLRRRGVLMRRPPRVQHLLAKEEPSA